jgi:DNA mismatch repair protein MutS
MKATDGETPLMRQYNTFKTQHPEALLLFRVGDFYETFGQDAVLTAKILNITLTKRANGSLADLELAGFPHHALDNYLPKLVRAGVRVAICDQLEDPKLAKGIVKRGITELVTPGLTLNDNVLNAKQNNFLASLYADSQSLGLAFLDISTGEFSIAQGSPDYAVKLLSSFLPSEIVFSKSQNMIVNDLLGSENFHFFRLEDWFFSLDFAVSKLQNHFSTTTLKGFGIEEMPLGIIAAGAVMQYLEHTEHKNLAHISSISRIDSDKYVWLDRFTVRNLELLSTQHEAGVPLIEVIDETLTPMGSRLLRRWVLLPLKDINSIEDRLSAVEALYQNQAGLDKLRELLEPIGDLERLVSKIATSRINPRELQQIKKALQSLAPIQELFAQEKNQLGILAEQLNLCLSLSEKIAAQLIENPPLHINQGGLIKAGVHAELDHLREISSKGKDYLLEIQQREIEKTGIASLKVAFNNVFGYYLEVRNLHKDKVPQDWIRKQTLANAERYITPELKEYEDKILTAETRITQIEQEIFVDLVGFALQFLQPLQQNAALLSTLDVLAGLATVARKYRYVRPTLTLSRDLDIKQGRHPVIERQLPKGEPFIPNDVYLGEKQQILIITGPNMAGKSALLRQVALITLLAQMGSFVPAESANIGLVDKIFTRVGASDNLSKGESTFMVEMTETAGILNNLSERSLIIMDEIGRGTSTYDGISIAWAIVEYLHALKPRTLFATHYHELTEIAKNLERVKNFHVSLQETAGKVIFLRKLKEGGSGHSFGINVAQMAGMPRQVLTRATEVLQALEAQRSEPNQKRKNIPAPQSYQLTLFQAADPAYSRVVEIINTLDPNTLSPIEALLKLNEIKKLLSAKS